MGDSHLNLPENSLLEPGERPTLKTISRITGLAIATVSRALHDAPDIGEATKKRVHEVAERVGYRPNRAGVRLRTGKTNVISLVLSMDHDVMNHTAKLISSVVGAMRNTPYHMIVTPYFPDEDPMVPIRYIVETGSADGIILNQITPEDPRVAYLMKQKIPFATHGRSMWRDKHPYFDFDNARFGEVAIEILSKRGRKNVLMVAPPADQNYGMEMISGAKEAAHSKSLAFSVLPGATSDSPNDDIEAALNIYIRENPETDAFICGSTTGAMACVQQAELAGRIVGKEVDVFAKEAIPFLSRFRNTILTVHEDVATAGNFLARAVIKSIMEPAAPPMQGMDVPEFKERSSD